MSTRALALIKKSLKTKNPYLELGNCALRDDHFATGSPLDVALRKCTHLETLILSNSWQDFEDKKISQSPNGGKPNILHLIPPAIGSLIQLVTLVCAGDSVESWSITDLSTLHELENLLRLDVGYNKIVDITGLEKLYALKQLKLPYNEINEIRGLSNLTALQKLDLDSNQIIEIKGVNNLKELRLLSLADNNISKIKGLNALTGLEHLNLNGNQIKQMDGLAGVQSLKRLYIRNNQLKYISGLNNLFNLEILQLSSNKITTISGLETLVNLQILSLVGNLITEIKGLDTLNNLKSLNLHANKITEIKGLDKLVALQELNLVSNQISEIKGLNTLINLQILTLYHNKITEIKGLDALTNLKKLYLQSNRLTEINGLHNLVTLQELVISINQITEIKGLDALANLHYLNLTKNRIAEIKGLDKLTVLKRLKLSNNKITEIKGLDYLTDIEELQLSLNRITEIKGLNKLTSLKTLILRHNQIQDIEPLLPLIQSSNDPLKVLTTPYRTFRISEVGIFIGDNPLIRPSIEIVNQGNEAILNYFKELERQGIDYLYEAKMLIIGQPRAGKTSLRYKLFDLQAPLPADDKTTRGIDIARISFDITDNNGKPRKFHYNVWDFGGQQIYQTTHQFFLTHRSLYALVLDTGKDSTGNDDNTINYWLQIVELLGGNSPLLLIMNEKSERKVHLDLPQKKARFGFLKGDYSVDLNALIPGTLTYSEKRKQAFEQLKKDIETTLTRLPLVGLPLPANWVKIREELQELSGTIPYISLEKYREICAGHEVSEYSQQLELSRIFHDLGVFLHFQDYDMLENFIVLQNTWATDAVFAVLDNENVQCAKGRFTEDDLAKIWQSQKYLPEVHKKLLGLMIRFELCYQVDRAKKGATYIVPEMLPDRAPAGYSWQPDNDLPLQYRYDFMPKGLLTRFIVRQNQHIYTDNGQQSVWKTGVRIDGDSMDCPNTFAEITEAWDNKQLNIRIQGSFARELMSKITLVIDELNKDYFRQIDQDDTALKSKWYKMIPCNCSTCGEKTTKHYYEYNQLLKRKEFGKPTVDCGLPPFDEVNINSLIEGVFAKTKSTSAQKPKNKPMKIFISYSKDDLPLVNNFLDQLAPLQLDGVVAHWYCTELITGTTWHKEIQDRFDQSDIVCFMVSPNFMRTQYIHEHEIKKAFERKVKDPSFKIVPIILDFCKWTTRVNNLGQFTALPYTAKPVVSFKNQNEAWYITVECLRLMIEKDLYPTGDGFYATQALPKDVLRLMERVVKGEADA